MIPKPALNRYTVDYRSSFGTLNTTDFWAVDKAEVYKFFGETEIVKIQPFVPVTAAERGQIEDERDYADTVESVRPQ